MVARMGNVRVQLEAIEEISTLPSVMVRIMTIVEDESSNAMDLAAEISMDQALTVRVLRTVNSSYYGFQHKILTIPEAVVLLGFSEIEKLALAISVVNLFGRDRASVKSLQMLWRHSLACSVAANVFELHLRHQRPGARGAHVAGLLHDIGKAVIAQYFPRAMATIESLINKEGLSACEAEREALDGITHCDIGAQIAERWDLPPALVESIALHHAPETAVVNPLMVHVTHLADEVCNSLGILSNAAQYVARVNPVSRDTLELDYEMIATIRTQLDRNRSLIGAVATGAMCG